MGAVTDDKQHIEYIIRLIYDRSRIRLHDGKEALIRARLGKRMRLHGIGSLGEYIHFLEGAGGEEEVTHAVDALTTNFTSFFRENDHFDFMVRVALPGLLSENRRRFNVWSAACATGEEPYSIAVSLAENYPVTLGWDWRIFATDISTKALGKAQQAIYNTDHVRTIPHDLLRKYFQAGHGKWDGHFRVKPTLGERVTFRQLNLLENPGLNTSFEIIFCRNVMIYFDRATQEQLVESLRRHLVPGGYLLTGHSESLSGLKTPLRCLRPSIYRNS